MSSNQPDYVEPPPTAPIIADPNVAKARELEIERAKLQVEKSVWKCCLNCDSWQEKGCAKWGNEPIMPPPSVIVVGCVGYTAIIPF